MPSRADSRLMTMRWSFLWVRTAIRAKMAREQTRGYAVTAANPYGRNTVCPTETTAAPIMPITAGRSPPMAPLTMALERKAA